MRYRFKNGYVLVDDAPLGEGASFVSYRGILFNDTFSEGKNVILKEYAPTKSFNQKYETSDRIERLENTTDEEIVCKEILPANKEKFLRQFQNLNAILSNVKELQKNKAIRDDIVDCYDEDIQLFDEALKPVTSLDVYDPASVSKVKYYRGLSIYYDDDFTPDGVLRDIFGIEDVLRILTEISMIIKRLHTEGFLHRDIKINNFLYKKKSDSFTVKMFDTDSIVFANKVSGICTSAPYSPSEAYRGEYYPQTDIYMLGATLFMMLLGEDSKKFIRLSYDDISGEQYRYICYEDLFSESNIDILIDKYQCTEGFLKRLRKIFSKSLANAYRDRYNCVDGFIEDLKILLDIYNHKGVHPEVILNSANEMAESPDFLKEYDENLLCEVEEVN